MPDEPNSDPLDLEAVDREIRLERLRREIGEIAGEELITGKLAEVEPPVEEAFLESVLAVEEHGFV